MLPFSTVARCRDGPRSPWRMATSRLTEFRHSKGGAFVLRRLAYDDADRPIREEIDAGAIPKPTGESWRQDTCDLADRVTSALGRVEGIPATWAYDYDGGGNLLEAARTITGEVASVGYAYDRAARMVAITNGAGVESYVYDAGGSRVKWVKDGTTRYFALDYADGFKRPLAEINSAGTILRRYVWAGAVLLAVVESNGVVRYAHSDGQGSVLALTDSAGNVTDQFAYGPYGEPWARTGTNELPFRWLGGSGVIYAGDGLYLTYRRLYDSSLKKFLQSDPKGIAGGLNLYAYGNLNPLVFVDPLGLCAESGGIRPFPGNDFGLNALLAKDRMRNTNPTRFYEVYGNDRDVQVEMALGLMLNIALMAFDLPAGLGTMRSASATRVAGSGLTTSKTTIGVMRGLRSGAAAVRGGTPIASVGLTSARRLGWVKPIPKYNLNAPWYRYVTPRFGIEAGLRTQGRTAIGIATTKAHEGQHIMDVLAHPQWTHLATKKGLFPGSGLARYALEYRGYSAGGELENIATPLRSLNALQKANLGMDVLLFGGGAAGAVYLNWGR